MGCFASAGETPAQRPLRRDAERNRQRILAAAGEVFAERGMAATLDDVAHRAGLGVGTVYRRFPNKESLAAALFAQRMDEVTELADAARARPDAWLGLCDLLEGLCELFARDRGLRDIMISSGPEAERLRDRKACLEPMIRELVQRAKREGELRPEISTEDVPLIAIMINAVAEYVGSIRPTLWRRYLAVMLDGLRAGHPTPAGLPEPLDGDELDRAMHAWTHRRG
jgi:AcrR family transcriptional regulator